MSPAVEVDSSSAREKWDGLVPERFLLSGFRWMESQRALLSHEVCVGGVFEEPLSVSFPGGALPSTALIGNLLNATPVPGTIEGRMDVP